MNSKLNSSEAGMQFAELIEDFDEAVATGRELGASIAIASHGEVLLERHGGWADPLHRIRWTARTLVNSWSLTKTLSLLAVLRLVDQRKLDLDVPVARYWPAFEQQAKGEITLAHILSHTSGVSGWDRLIQVHDLFNLRRSAEWLAEQTPWWPPGSQSGYHALTFGTLLDGVLHHGVGSSLKESIRDDLASITGADVQLGLRLSDLPRVATLVPGFDKMPEQPVDAGETSIRARTLRSPTMRAQVANTPEWRAASIGAANGHVTSTGLAVVNSLISSGGRVAGHRRLSQELVDRIYQPLSDGVDLVLGHKVRFGLGLALPDDQLPLQLPSGACAWGGWGGSVVINDRTSGLTFVYVMNLMGPASLGSPRSERYVKAFVEGIGGR